MPESDITKVTENSVKQLHLLLVQQFSYKRAKQLLKNNGIPNRLRKQPQTVSNNLPGAL